MRISDRQFAQLMEAIQASQDRVDSKLAEFCTEVRQSQEDAVMKAVKRVCSECQFVYKRKGNKEQVTFIAKVEDTIVEAVAKARSSPALEHAQDALSRGRKLLLERDKLIKIADRSEFGWGVVSKYMADELAEDSNMMRSGWRKQRRRQSGRQ